MYSFEEIVGHKEIIEGLQQGIKSKKVSHSYIFDGIEGIGKKTLAYAYAKTLQCLKEGISPCNECISCRSFDSGNHPDVFFIKSEKKNLGVDEIREGILKEMEIKPYKYKYKIFIVENADNMTVQAQNALLKTIEEPPAYGIIILISTNYEQFLPTIISRCSLIKLNLLKPEEVKAYFINTNEFKDKNIDIYISFSEGSIGKVKKMLESEYFMDLREKVIGWIQEIKNEDLINIYKIQKEMENYKEDIELILYLMYIWYRDVLLIKHVGDNSYIINKDKVNILLNHSMDLSYNNIDKVLDAINNARIQISKNANLRLTLEVMLLQIKENDNG
ncbi:MAG TPA: DNA polymerase III subunit delta' [Defluviitaleaceae bacterium]|nr:DNA polymerase III subunit delta' [Candidatus Epulonipiscium sp.]HOA79951.1 DNA polymerase III subunit delta' [Defluviitaleaceae bacterium]